MIPPEVEENVIFFSLGGAISLLTILGYLIIFNLPIEFNMISSSVVYWCIAAILSYMYIKYLEGKNNE